MRLIECGRKILNGKPINWIEADWKPLPVTVNFDALHYNKYWFRINGKVYNWNSPAFTKAFNEARAWELLAK